MATGYGQLGALAQDRGDYEEAERRYRQALDINERLGNQAGIATSYAALGNLSWERSLSDKAIAWHVRALGIRLGIGAPQVLNNLRALSEYRDQLGTKQFQGILAQVAGAETAEAVVGYLGQLEAATVSDQ